MVIDFLKGRFSKQQAREQHGEQPHLDREDESHHVSERDEQMANLRDLPRRTRVPLVISRKGHCVSRQMIDGDALRVMYRLLHHGFKAYLVGGGVRDLLLGKRPKDFDIGTDARPEQVRKIFRNSRIIGRRFRINHVFFPGNKIFEVATFRALSEQEEEETAVPRLITSDNEYGDSETDALRRDLTINGLFYDLSTYSVIDYVGGVEDLHNGIIRMIGEPVKRFQEDPVRMIRAIRHAARTGFRIHEDTYAALCSCAQLISLSSRARVYEEFIRELRGGFAHRSLSLLHETGLLRFLVPVLGESFAAGQEPMSHALDHALREIDIVAKQGPEIPAGVLFAALLIDHFIPPLASQSASAEEGREGNREITVEQYFHVSPQPRSDHAAGAIFPNLPAAALKRSRRREKTVEKSELRSIINELFSAFGLPKKQRDLMECVLVGRYLMFHALTEESLVSTLLEKPYFEEMLLTLRLTASDERSKQCRSFWEEQRAKRDASRNFVGHRGRRRGRRRRRSRGRNENHFGRRG